MTNPDNPIVTDKHRECAAEILKGTECEGTLFVIEVEEILAKHFPAEPQKYGVSEETLARLVAKIYWRFGLQEENDPVLLGILTEVLSAQESPWKDATAVQG